MEGAICEVTNIGATTVSLAILLFWLNVWVASFVPQSRTLFFCSSHRLVDVLYELPIRITRVLDRAGCSSTQIYPPEHHQPHYLALPLKQSSKLVSEHPMMIGLGKTNHRGRLGTTIFPYINMTNIIDRSAPPNYKLFGIVTGAIAVIAVSAAAIGCLTAKLCKRRRQKQIDRVLAKQAASHDAGANARTSASTVSSLAQTVVVELDEEDAIIERRTQGLLAQNAFIGREQEEYQRKIRAKQGEETVLPVRLGDLIRWAKRTFSREDATPHQAGMSEKTSPRNTPPAARMSPAPRQSRALALDTSTSYEDPQQILSDLEAQVHEADLTKQKEEVAIGRERGHSDDTKGR